MVGSRNWNNLRDLKDHISDKSFPSKWRKVKLENKLRLATEIESRTGIEIDPDMLFDVQVKRIHEYKRQLLNVLHAVHLYDRIQRGDGDDLPPRAIIIGGKAAPGYVMAKSVIKGDQQRRAVINSDPAMPTSCGLIFYPTTTSLPWS